MTAAADALRHAAECLAAAGIESAGLDARVLLAHALGVEVGELRAATYPLRPPSFASLTRRPPPPQAGEDKCISASDDGARLSSPACGGGAERSDGGGGDSESLSRFEQYIARRERREPVAYITGTKGFWTLDLDIGPGALVPRPETETLVEQAMEEFPDRSAPLRVLDLGVGSGAILLAFLSEYPNASGIGIDRAQEWAMRNAAKLGMGGRAHIVAADWRETPDERFDVIFSNPPYLTAAEVEAAAPELAYEPRGALDGGADGLDAYRALAPLIASRLNKSGFAFLEIGQGQAEAVSRILAEKAVETIRAVADLSSIPRCIVARLAEKPWKGRDEPVVSLRG